MDSRASRMPGQIISIEKCGGNVSVPSSVLIHCHKTRFSWVHRDDLVSLIVEALSNPAYEGAINGTAPNPVRFTELCDRLGKVLGRPSWLPVPDFAVKAILGEGATLVLEGQRVLPKKAQELGFRFKYQYVKDALQAILA